MWGWEILILIFSFNRTINLGKVVVETWPMTMVVGVFQELSFHICKVGTNNIEVFTIWNVDGN